ncbi:protein kinase [Streptomyces sp. NPDC018031]|uniref:serine/threonine-protein kinase n=1 Tax=Streptomyces sp. NPDC018031 TaxID=3365033 RepID=UPI00379275E0
MTGRFSALEADDPDTVGGYALRARIGSGGMGRVYLAFSPGGRPLAVKVVRPDYAHDPEFRRRFKREIKAARSVEDLYTAPVVDADSEASLPWLATAYVPGPSLAQAVAEHGPLPLATVFRLIAGVAEGLMAVHACGLVHRDLKPANILLADDGPRVIDFGIAHAANATSATTTGLRIGTPAYMAPEQVRGRSAGPPTDVFALGGLAVYAATGQAAFGEGNTEALFYRILHEDPELDACPAPLRGLVRRCLAKEPPERPTLDRIMAYAARRAERETLDLARGWLPAPVVSTLAAYDTAKYKKPEKPKKSRGSAEPEKHSATATTEKRPAPKPTKQLPDGKKPPTAAKRPPAQKKPSPKPDTAPPPSSGSDYAWLGYLAAAAAAVVLVIGPAKFFDWLESQLAEKPTASASASKTPSSEGAPAPRQPTRAPEPAYTPEPEETLPAGCEDALAAITEFGKAPAVGTSAFIDLEVDLESAASDADDAEVSRAINDLADDTEELRSTLNDIEYADNSGDTWRGDQLRDYYKTVSDRMGDNLALVQQLCS